MWRAALTNILRAQERIVTLVKVSRSSSSASERQSMLFSAAGIWLRRMLINTFSVSQSFATMVLKYSFFALDKQDGPRRIIFHSTIIVKFVLPVRTAEKLKVNPFYISNGIGKGNDYVGMIRGAAPGRFVLSNHFRKGISKHGDNC